MLPSSADTKSVFQWEEDDQEEAGRRKRIAKLLLKKKKKSIDLKLVTFSCPAGFGCYQSCW